jgi:hypothetical protein
VRRMFPPALMKSRRSLGVRFGPRPVKVRFHSLQSLRNVPYLSTVLVTAGDGHKLSRPIRTVQAFQLLAIRL